VLEVYDAVGQRVRSLVSQRLPAGLHTFLWDGRNADGQALGSGVYFARLRASEFSAVRKMVLLR
jgi:flagellar hook assembly protein FlgD